MRRVIVSALRLLRALASAATLAALLAGLPWALARFVGWPLPHRMPGVDQVQATLDRPLTGTVLQDLLACVVWLLWAGFLVAVLTETLYLARGLRAPRIRVLSPVQAVAALLVAGLSITPAAGAVIATVPVVPAPPSHTISATLVRSDLPDTRIPATSATAMYGAAGYSGGARASSSPAPRLVLVGGQHYTYPVVRGDTLWHIAGAWLGNPLRWPEIYHLNQSHYDQHGRMRGGDHIEPGWVLVLPDDATPPAGASPVSPPAPAGPPAAPSPPPVAPVSPGTSASALPSDSPSPSTSPQPAASQPGNLVPTPGTTGAGTVASPAPSAPPASPQPRVHPGPPGFTLPGGGWVDAGLAAAIAAAAALVWIQRRRRYTPRPPSADLRLDDPDLAPMPPVVTAVRRRLRRATRPGDAGLDLLTDADQDVREDADPTLSPDVDPGAEPDVEPDVDLDFFADLDIDGDLDQVEHGDDPGAESHDGAPGGDPDGEATSEDLATGAGLVPVAPALDHPLLQVWPPAGLGLTGPGAEPAARGFLVAALAADGTVEPDARSKVVVPAGTLATLLGTEAVQVGDTPRLTVTAGLGEALDLLEATTLHRTRLAYEHEVDTVTALRDADPLEEPLPPVLLIADATAVHQRARVASLLTQGQRLDIHGILLGEWADGNTVHVTADGSTGRGDQADSPGGRHGAHPADVGRLAVIDPTQAADLLRTLAEAHTGAPQPAPPVEAALPTATPARSMRGGDATVGNATRIDEETPNPDNPAGGATNDEKATPARPDRAGHVVAAPTSVSGTEPGDDQPGDGPHARRSPAARPEPEPAEPDAADGVVEGAVKPVRAGATGDAGTAAGPARARAYLLGSPRVDNLPPPSRTDPMLRPQAMELLVYLVAHGGKASRDDILYDVLGDAPQSKAAGRLNTFVYSLRRSLKTSAGGRAGVYVGPPDEDYALGRDLIDLDLWRMQVAITAAQAASGQTERVAALREAIGCYTGPLAEGKAYEWIEPYREAVRRQAVDAHTALADALAATDPAEAAAVLEAAIGHDPYNDALYQQAMRLHARLGDSDAVRRLRKTLTRRLGEIDAEPAPDTTALADQLLTDLARRPRQPRRVRGDAA